MKHALVFAASIVFLAACSSGPQPAPPPSSGTTFHPAPEMPAPPPPRQSIRPSAPVPTQTPDYHPMAEDQCGAADLQYLIGKPRTEIPVPLDPSRRRVVCSTCIITQDFRADRQTITFDTDTGLIKSIRCG